VGATARHVRWDRTDEKEASHDRSVADVWCSRCGGLAVGRRRTSDSTTGRRRTGSDGLGPLGLHAADVRAGGAVRRHHLHDGFDPWIEQFGLDGITAGCGGGNYCPGTPVTRDQMAVFLEKAMRGTSNLATATRYSSSITRLPRPTPM